MKSWTGCLLLLVTILTIIVTTGIIIKRAEPIKPTTFPEEELYPFLSRDLEESWINTLAHGKINRVEMWNPYGLSKKFKVYFEDGKVASGKLMHPFSLWNHSFRKVNFRTVDRDHKRYSRSAWGDYQAMSELGAFYLDRALDLYRKPPTSGRKIPSHLMYANDDTWFGFFQRVLPEYDVEVTLIGWFDGISVRPPSTIILETMLQKNGTGLRKNFESCADVSDVLVFDYLIDDHDRIEAHNWLKDRNGKYIFWDSGLGFRHGPHGKRERDQEIFCGRREWATLTAARTENKQCEKVCMFRRSTIEMLRTFGWGTPEVPGPKLSKLVIAAMKNDPLYPVFDRNVYLPGRGRFPKISYRPQDFFDGFDIRLRELLLIVDGCIQRFGERNVLI